MIVRCVDVYCAVIALCIDPIARISIGTVPAEFQPRVLGRALCASVDYAQLFSTILAL